MGEQHTPCTDMVNMRLIYDHDPVNPSTPSTEVVMLLWGFELGGEPANVYLL